MSREQAVSLLDLYNLPTHGRFELLDFEQLKRLEIAAKDAKYRPPKGKDGLLIRHYYSALCRAAARPAYPHVRINHSVAT